MKNRIVSIVMISASLGVLPAAAATMTIEFASDSGGTQVWTLDDDGSATSAVGGEASYSYDSDARILCARPEAGGEVCITFEDDSDGEVGATSRYTTSSGDAGLATIVGVSE